MWRSIGRATIPRGPLRTTVAHYDLGNRFFSAWLDETMTYSSALFTRDDMTLEEAQLEKYRRIAEVTGLDPGMRVLEIGSGWGGFAMYAAERSGAMSRPSRCRRSRRRGSNGSSMSAASRDLITIRLEDFAATTGSFDAIVSIEMIESIPSSRWPDLFRVVHDRLEPGGRAGLQIITVADRHWESSDANPDFVASLRLPRGQVPSPRILRAGGPSRRTGVDRRRQLRLAYARNARRLANALDPAGPLIADLGFDDRFNRMWQYYLSYCEGGFRSGRADVSQIVLERSADRPTISRRSGVSAADSR